MADTFLMQFGQLLTGLQAVPGEGRTLGTEWQRGEYVREYRVCLQKEKNDARAVLRCTLEREKDRLPAVWQKLN
jgi:hypothetical protein